MPEIGSASLAVIPSFKGFQSNLENGSSKALTAAGVSGGEKFGDAAAKSGGARFKAGIAKAAKVAAAGLAVAAAGAIKFAGDALEEAREAQKVGALTESTIKATGKAAKVTAQQVGDLSNAISKKSGIDDEAIQSGANMLLTFKNIRNEAGKGNKIFNRTTRATADMAAAMAGGKGGEIDLKSASILLGKALNDPVKGLTALTRVGVTFTDQQKAINKALVEGGTLNAMAAFGTKVTAAEFAKIQKENNATTQETVDIIMGPMSRAQRQLFKHYEEGGHALEAQRNILKELNSEFGGAAAAQSTEADKLRVAWGNFKEEIGTQLIPVMDDLSRFLRKKGIPEAEKFVNWFKNDGVDGLKKFGGYVKDAAGYMKDLVGWVDKLPSGAKWTALAALVGGAGVSKLRGGNMGTGGGVLGGIGRAVGMAKPLPVFVTNMGAGGGMPLLPGGPAGSTAAGSAAKVSKAAKVGSFVAKAYWPAAIVATATASLKNLWDWNHSDDTKLGAMSGGKIGDWARGIANAGDEARDAKAVLDNVNNAAEKVERQLGDTKNAGQKLVDTLFAVGKSDPKVTVSAPGFDALFDKTVRYGSLLDGLDNRTITTFFRSVTRNNDTGEGGGGTVPGRSPSGVNVHIDRVEAHDYNDFMSQVQNRTRSRSLDGVG